MGLHADGLGGDSTNRKGHDQGKRVLRGGGGETRRQEAEVGRGVLRSGGRHPADPARRGRYGHERGPR